MHVFHMIAQTNLSPTDYNVITTEPTVHYSVMPSAATTNPQDPIHETLSAASSMLHLTL